MDFQKTPKQCLNKIEKRMEKTMIIMRELTIPKILKDIDDLKSEIVRLKNAKPTASSDYCQSEDALLSEIHDRLRRSNNVLLFNAPESNNDMKSATDIFNKLSSEPVPIRSTVRFGKRYKLGYRTLKVTLPSNHNVRTVLNGGPHSRDATSLSLTT
ncbi:hypothetical protein JTB14_025134 [Gonioctena quinquepunctata]|nr:hypothetical protein JTB14_025134 [Gonioctena quinquepunctata]